MKWPWSKKETAVVPVKNAPTEAQRRSYAAAQLNRLTSDWMNVMSSADENVRGSLRVLRARGRDLGRNNDWVRGILREYEVNIIGRGVNLQMQVKKQRGGVLDDEINGLIETEFYRWMKAENCDVAGQLRFQEMEALIVRNWAESGEIIIRKIRQPFGRSKVPFALELIEVDQLDDELNGPLVNGNRAKMGVELNAWNRPVAYHILVKHPNEHSFGVIPDRRGLHRIRVPAEEIIHIFRTERPGQTRGVPVLISTMMRLRQMHGYEEAEVVFARASASLMGFIESDAEQLEGDAEIDGQAVTDFEAGVIKQLRPGETMNVPNFSRPGGQLEPFVRSNLRAVAAGTGPSYTAVSADYSQSNYSSERAAILKERDMWRMMQDWIIAKFHQPVFESWLEMAWMSGVLKLPKYETNAVVYEESTKWFPRGWAWIDPEKEVKSYKEAVRSGFMTQQEVLQQSGSDIEEYMSNRKREIDLAAKNDIVLDTDPKHVSNAGLTQARPAGSEIPEA